MTMVVVVILMAVWMCALCWMGVRAIEWVYEGRRNGFMWGVATILLFAVPVGLVLDGARHDDDARLCASGHQEWRTMTSGPVLVGKVVVPGGTSTRKVWVCERWQ